MGGKYYVLDKTTHKIKEVDLMEWATMFDGDFESTRRVAEDYVSDVHISTVFLGLNHRWGDGPPLLFETMIFGGKHDEYQERYTTWDEAVEGHKKAVELVKSDLP